MERAASRSMCGTCVKSTDRNSCWLWIFPWTRKASPAKSASSDPLSRRAVSLHKDKHWALQPSRRVLYTCVRLLKLFCWYFSSSFLLFSLAYASSSRGHNSSQKSALTSPTRKQCYIGFVWIWLSLRYSTGLVFISLKSRTRFHERSKVSVIWSSTESSVYIFNHELCIRSLKELDGFRVQFLPIADLFFQWRIHDSSFFLSAIKLSKSIRHGPYRGSIYVLSNAPVQVSESVQKNASQFNSRWISNL